MKVSDTTLEQREYEAAVAHLKQARIFMQLDTEGGAYKVKWRYAFRNSK